MNREEAQIFIDKQSNRAIHYKDGINVITVRSANILADMLCEEMKNRTCENCKHIEYRKSDNESYCILNNTTYRDPVANDFGCNRFERKDNE